MSEAEQNDQELTEAEQNYQELTDGDGSVARAVRLLLTEAVADGATDVHINTCASQDGERVEARLRLRNELVEHAHWPSDVGIGVISRFQHVGCRSLQTAEPLDGVCEIDIPTEDGGVARCVMRLYIAPLHRGTMLTIRLLSRDKPSDLGIDELFPADETLAAGLIRSALSHDKGLIVVAGATLSGKSTTLAAMMGEIVVPTRKILDVEDVVEITVPGVNQMETRDRVSTDAAIRACMRADADAIFVGEVQSQAAAMVAVGAACAFDLVVAAIHARDATAALTRLINWGVGEKALAECIHLVMAQRLIGRLCQACSSSGVPMGCAKCKDGYSGRMALVETLGFNVKTRTMLADGAAPEALRAALSGADDYQSFADHAKHLIQNKVTTDDQVVQVLGADWDCSPLTEKLSPTPPSQGT